MSSLSGGPEQDPALNNIGEAIRRHWPDFPGTLSEAELQPTIESNGAVRIDCLKRDLVASLFLQHGPFWEAVLRIRTKWGVHPKVTVPSEDDLSSTRPEDKLPRKKLWVDDREWDDDLRSLIERFVPGVLVRSGWQDFLGGCVMCDPPDDRLSEFAEFGRVFPRPFWPVVDCEDEDIDKNKLRSMVAPPIETIFKEHHDAGEPFMEYRIVVDEHTKKADVMQAFRAIKDVLGGGRPGRTPMDKLTAIQCAILYDDHNGPDPGDRRAPRTSPARYSAPATPGARWCAWPSGAWPRGSCPRT